MVSFEFKHDEFKKVRGTWSRLLNISCRKCGTLVAVYQKDGPGNLRRLYLDRIFGPEKLAALQQEPLENLPILKCDHCREILGTPCKYEKENRKAFRLYQDAVIKKVRRIKAAN